jgi:hypothetical protein
MKSGRSSHVPTEDTRKHVLISRGLNIPLKRIAGPMGIGVKALKKFYAKELREGFAYVCEVADKSLLKLMAAGNLGAIVWFDKTRRGMRESTSVEHALANRPPPPKLGISFEDGGPGRVRTTPADLNNLESLRTVTIGEDSPASEPIEMPSGQIFLPAQPAQKPSLSVWERLGLPAEESNRQNQAAMTLEPVFHVAGHPACPCDSCKAARPPQRRHGE